MRVALPKLIKHLVQSLALFTLYNRMLEIVHDGPQRDSIGRIVQQQVLNQNHSDEILLRMLVDGYARVPMVEDILKRVEIEYRVDVEREGLFNRLHYFAGAFVLEVERARDQLVLFLLDVLAVFCLSHELAHFVTAVCNRYFFAQEIV